MKEERKESTSNTVERRSEGSKSRQGKKRPFKSKSREYRKEGNDPAWYAADPAILRDVASIPYSWSMGTSIDMKYPTDVAPFKRFLPGVCILWTRPTFGRSEDPSSALNIAATSMYTWVRHANSGHSNYDQNDLMIYVGAMASVYSYLNYLFRTYGLVTLFSQKNRYLPKFILESQYINYESLSNNLSNFRAAINILVNKAASLAVPADIPYFRRQAFMYQNVYTEGGVKDQMYLYAPDGFYKFTLDNSGAGQLAYTRHINYGTVSTSKTWEDLIRYGEELLAPLVSDEDFNIMSGDIMKAYGGKIITLNSLPEVYPIIPIHDEAVLEQMQNAQIVRSVDSTGDVTQDSTKSYLLSKPSTSWARGGTYANNATSKMIQFFTGNKMLTTKVEDAGPDVTIENTRLMCGFDNYKETETERSIDIYPGSDMCVKVEFTGFYEGATHTIMKQSVAFDSTFTAVDLDDTVDDAARFFGRSEFISVFKYRPEIVMIVYRHGTTAPAVQYNQRFHSYWSVDNFAVLDCQDRIKINDAALLNLLNVPRVAKIIK